MCISAIVARQRLGKNVTAATMLTVGRFVFYVVRVVIKGKLGDQLSTELTAF
jgi:hypothetical protein